MRKFVFVLTVIALSSVTVFAYAGTSVTRGGLDYSGTRQEGSPCVVSNDEGRLDVKCLNGAGPLYVRFRFLKDVGAIRDNATVSMVSDTWKGEDCTIRWMVNQPKSPARTARITIPSGSYCDIATVEWSQ